MAILETNEANTLCCTFCFITPLQKPGLFQGNRRGATDL